MIIHKCDYASQPDIKIKCTGEWTQPAWVKNEIENIYLVDNGNYYTFDEELVTCQECMSSK